MGRLATLLGAKPVFTITLTPKIAKHATMGARVAHQEIIAVNVKPILSIRSKPSYLQAVILQPIMLQPAKTIHVPSAIVFVLLVMAEPLTNARLALLDLI